MTRGTKELNSLLKLVCRCAISNMMVKNNLGKKISDDGQENYMETLVYDKKVGYASNKKKDVTVTLFFGGNSKPMGLGDS